jgi:hypothetical protein
MSSPANAVPDIQLGVTNEEIALLRHHQQAAASGKSSSGTASRASSPGPLILDIHSLGQLSRHFDRLLQQVQERLDYLSEQSQVVALQQYDRAGNAIPIADSEIAHVHDIIRQVDELEVDFDRVRHIRDIVRAYRQRIEEMEMEETLQNNTSGRRTPSHRHHGEVKTEHRTVPSHSTPPIQEESDARHPTVGKLAAYKVKAENVKIDTAEHERPLRRDEQEKKRAEAEVRLRPKLRKRSPPRKILNSNAKVVHTLRSEALMPWRNTEKKNMISCLSVSSASQAVKKNSLARKIGSATSRPST